MEPAFAGIDVAFAKGKRLPIVVARRCGAVLAPLPLRNWHERPPKGQGNVGALERTVLEEFASSAAKYLQTIESKCRVKIARIAIDAPSMPRADGVPRRAAEVELDSRRISCITTPDTAEFDRIVHRARDHLASGGAESRLPAANQLWMLAGFELFRRLRLQWECLEVFPQAIVVALGASQVHKSQAAGRASQLMALARETGWPRNPRPEHLKSIAFGSSSDKLDAYLAAWVASLHDDAREPLGVPPADAIWIPRLRLASLRPGAAVAD